MNKKILVLMFVCLFLVGVPVQAAILNDWEDAARTAYFDFEEGSGTTIIDGTSGSSHNGTEVNTHAGNYETDTPNSTGYSANFSTNSYYNLNNYADFGAVSEFEIMFALKHPNATEGANKVLFSGDNTDIRIRTYSGRISVEINTDDVDCAINWFEYSTFLTDDQWYFLNVFLNSTHCGVVENATNLKRAEASNGSIQALGSYFHVGQDNSQTINYGQIDCLSIYAGNTLNQSARVTARDYCGNFSIDQTPAANNVDKEIFVENITYILPRTNENVTIGADLMINFTINNSGANATDNFNYTFLIDDTEVCGNRINISGQTTTDITCNWTTTYGFKVGEIRLDTLNEVAELDENNSNISVYIPMVNRPWSFNKTTWNAIYFPYVQNTSNHVAYDTYNWYKTFLADAFNNGWTAAAVDPRAKKGRENAVACLVNNYNTSYEACIRARNHLFGWANRTEAWEDASVQATHELIHVGITYDIMYLTLNSTDRTYLSKEYERICQAITNDDNTLPYKDDPTSIAGGNGKGFGSGLGAFCFLITGEYQDNPSLILQNESGVYHNGYSINDAWNGRITRYLQAYKNDSESGYQEGTLYKWYSQYHLVDIMTIWKQINYTNILTPYQNALNAMAKENLYIMLDYTYAGDTIRGDESNNFRSIPLGDSHSYESVGTDGDGQSWAVITQYALLSNEQTTKEALVKLRLFGHDSGDSTRSMADINWYPILREQANISADINTYQKFFYDNANDKATWRTNYTYENDTVIQVDGGEERGGGHSQVQGFYLYALGEPFLDYGEVPYEDDIRQESWRNVLTFMYNVTARYLASCGDYSTYYYYGSNDCVQQGTYPDFQDFNKTYGGDLEDSFGSSDGKKGGTYRWTPIRTTTPSYEYFVIFDDWMLRRARANSPTGTIIDNNINILEEFTATTSGGNISINRKSTNKNLDVDLIYSNITMTALTGNSTIQGSSVKTGAANLDFYYQNITLYGTGSDVDLIRSYTWYYNGSKNNVSLLDTGADIGAVQGNKVILFDADNDGDSTNGTYYSNGWAIAYDVTTQRVMSFNTTNISIGSKTLYNSNATASVFITESSNIITVEINTMSLENYVDTSKPILVTIDADNLTNNTNFTVQKNGADITSTETGTLVTFTVQTDQNGDNYTITSNNGTTPVNDTSPPTWVQTPSNQSTLNTSLPTYDVNATDDVAVDIYRIINDGNFTINSANGIITVATRVPNNYSFNVTVNDTSGNELSIILGWEINDGGTTTSSCLSINNSTITALGGAAALVTILIIVIVGVFFHNIMKGDSGAINDLPIVFGTIVFTMVLVGVGIVVISLLGGVC